MTLHATALAALALGAASCDQPGPSMPTAPGTTPAANQAPQISAGTISPALGIDEVTTFTVRADVRDPDGDQVSLRMLGCPFGQEVPLTVENGIATLAFTSTRLCASNLTLAASDGRGGSSQITIPFAHTALRGPFRLVLGDAFYDAPFFSLLLEQNGSVVTGTVRDHRYHAGVIDPQEPGTVDAAGRFHLRFKIPSEGDLVVTGQVTSADFSLFSDVTVASGSVIDGPYAGRAFKLWREAQY
jgi:hypothetical protein